MAMVKGGSLTNPMLKLFASYREQNFLTTYATFLKHQLYLNFFGEMFTFCWG